MLVNTLFESVARALNNKCGTRSKKQLGSHDLGRSRNSLVVIMLMRLTEVHRSPTEGKQIVWWMCVLIDWSV